MPKRTQEELAVLQELILSNLTNVRMIILYGSYARGKYVIWDETYDERGVTTYYQSDLDILVICDTRDANKAERHAREVIVPKYDTRMEGKRHPAPPSIIVENPTTINRAIRRKHYFFYEIIKDGILLYNDGTFQIGKPEKLPYREIKQYAEEEYANVFPTHTFEDNKAFDKLCRAYIEARYNRLFTVSKEQYEYMLARTEVLREVTIRECAARMAYYDEMIEKEEKEKI